MSYIIIHTTNKKVAQTLYQLEKGKHGERSPYKPFFVLNLGNSQINDTKVMKNNGIVLTYISKLYQAHPNEVYVWVAERLTLRDFPEKCKEGGKWLNKLTGRRLRDAPKAIGLTKEELEKIKLKYELKQNGK